MGCFDIESNPLKKFTDTEKLFPGAPLPIPRSRRSRVILCPVNLLPATDNFSYSPHASFPVVNADI